MAFSSFLHLDAPNSSFTLIDVGYTVQTRVDEEGDLWLHVDLDSLQALTLPFHGRLVMIFRQTRLAVLLSEILLLYPGDKPNMKCVSKVTEYFSPSWPTSLDLISFPEVLNWLILKLQYS